MKPIIKAECSNDIPSVTNRGADTFNKLYLSDKLPVITSFLIYYISSYKVSPGKRRFRLYRHHSSNCGSKVPIYNNTIILGGNGTSIPYLRV